jgi:Kef-type K+ transport system membrane component KefB
VALVVNLFSEKLRVPYTLGLVIVGLVIGFIGLTPEAQLSPELVLFVFLPALLFEGAWNAKLSLLRENWRAIFFPAGPGLLLSLVIIGAALQVLDQPDWATALLLAAILSPTDPVAVLGLFRQLHVNERLSNLIEGESLFNDGVAGSLYQTFLALVLLTLHGQAPTGLAALGNGLLMFVVEAGGGLLFGALAGFFISYVSRRIDDPVVESTIILLSAYGIYWVADMLWLSAIVAVIVTALILGNYGRATGMSARTRSDADTFWRRLAFLGNALIFLLMGVQIHPLDGNRSSVYSSPTTAVQRVEATPHVLRMPTTQEWQKLLGFNRCGVSQPVQKAGAEKTRAGLAVYPQRPFRRRVWADHAPFWLPLPNGSFGDIFRELQRRSPGRYQPLHIRTLTRGMRKIRAYPARKLLRSNGKRNSLKAK